MKTITGYLAGITLAICSVSACKKIKKPGRDEVFMSSDTDQFAPRGASVYITCLITALGGPITVSKNRGKCHLLNP
jgi:hypothetical protein